MRRDLNDHGVPPTGSRHIARSAVVIGAGIAGLAAAAALSDWFDQVVLLERDLLPAQPAHRFGTPHDRHTHGLLVGGLQAVEELLPGMIGDFVDLGAVPVRFGQDALEELPDGRVVPQRDFGLCAYGLSRPVLEFAIRRRLLERRNIAIRQDAHAVRIAVRPGGRRVAGVVYETGADRHVCMIDADIVIDASAHGRLSLEVLKAIGAPLPPQEAIEMGLGYTTAVLHLPDGGPTDWKLAVTEPDAPNSTRRAVMLAIEGGRWTVTVAGLRDERPPSQWPDVLSYLTQLTTPTIHDAVRDAEPVGKLARWNLSASIWRHFDRAEGLPDGLIPIGDAVCRFNPAYAQGMTVAAREAVLLRDLIRQRASQRDPLAGLGRMFQIQAAQLIATPWMMAALPDLAFPLTIGGRPDDLEESLQFMEGLSRVAAKDATVQRLMVEVWHLLKPRSVLGTPELVRRVRAELATCVGKDRQPDTPCTQARDLVEPAYR